MGLSFGRWCQSFICLVDRPRTLRKTNLKSDANSNNSVFFIVIIYNDTDISWVSHGIKACRGDKEKSTP